MERRVAFGRVERWRGQRVGADAGDGEASRLRPRALIERPVYGLHAPEIRAVVEAAHRVRRDAGVRRVLLDDRRERRRRAHLPVVGDDARGIGNRRPRDRERLLNARAVCGRERRRSGRYGEQMSFETAEQRGGQDQRAAESSHHGRLDGKAAAMRAGGLHQRIVWIMREHVSSFVRGRDRHMSHGAKERIAG